MDFIDLKSRQQFIFKACLFSYHETKKYGSPFQNL